MSHEGTQQVCQQNEIASEEHAASIAGHEGGGNFAGGEGSPAAVGVGVRGDGDIGGA
jgi:hypothetical protein